MNNQPVTIKDVAKHAGVSTATVSRVLNNDRRILEPTRLKVQKSLSELGYNMNAVARGLRTKKTFTIGFVTANIVSDYCMTVAQGVDDAISRNGYTMFMCGSGRNLEEEKLRIRMLLQKSVDGIIIMPATHRGEHYQEIQKKQVPVVLIDRFVEGFETDTVLVENVESTARAIEFLFDQGYRQMGMIAGNPLMTSSIERVEGYKLAHQRRGVPLDSRLIRYCENTRESSAEAMRELIEHVFPLVRVKRPCVFTANYKLFVGAVMYIHGSRRKGAPVSLASFDDPADLTHVPSGCLVSVSQPMQQIGEKAAELLLRRMRGDRMDFPTVLRLKPELRIFSEFKRGAVLVT